jgi:hypothetical protein
MPGVTANHAPLPGRFNHRVNAVSLTRQRILDNVACELFGQVFEHRVHEVATSADVAPDECEMQVRLRGDIAQRHRVYPSRREKKRGGIEESAPHLIPTHRRTLRMAAPRPARVRTVMREQDHDLTPRRTVPTNRTKPPAPSVASQTVCW